MNATRDNHNPTATSQPNPPGEGDPKGSPRWSPGLGIVSPRGFFSTTDGDGQEPLSLREAVMSGDYRSILIAQRLELAESIPVEKGPAKAALHRQLTIVAKELERLESIPPEATPEATAPDEPFDLGSI
jgi:hypothetical protein